MKMFFIRNGFLFNIIIFFTCLIFYPIFGQKIIDNKERRYLLYDVNPGEGFNLRRDVYIRMANLVKFLRDFENWHLVLPPWGNLYHWQNYDVLRNKIPWKSFFDLDSLARHVPVIEFHEFLNLIRPTIFHQVYYLQRFKGGWNGEWTEKIEIAECLDETGFVKSSNQKYRWTFFGYTDTHEIQIENFNCLSVQAEIMTMRDFILDKNIKSLFLPHGEQLIHGAFSEWSREWWEARRSMRFSQNLIKRANEFREKYLNSTDVFDKTVQDENWQIQKKTSGEAVGGPYIAVHLRRKDFLYGHKDDVPSIEHAAKQLRTILHNYQLKILFVATDAPLDEINKLIDILNGFQIYYYRPDEKELHEFKDGGIAIIDQLIAIHSRFFIGTHHSTFSFRIHEERQLLGFKPEVTFNALCGDGKLECEQPSKWPVVY